MMKHRGRTRLTSKAPQRRIVGNKLAHQDLDCHVVADAHATRAVDHAHAAFTELRCQLVLAVDNAPDERIRINEPHRWQRSLIMVLVVRMWPGGIRKTQRQPTFGTKHCFAVQEQLALWAKRMFRA